MSATGELTTKLLEQVLDNFRKTAEAGMAAQQELLKQWTGQAGGMPKLPWAESLDKFPKEWSKIATDLMKKHQEMLNTQYKANVEALERAMRVTQAKDPEDFRQRCVDLCRTSLDTMCDSVQAQLKEFQGATNRMLELMAKAPHSKA